MQVYSKTGKHLFANLPAGVWRDYTMRTVCGVVFSDFRGTIMDSWFFKKTTKLSQRPMCKRCIR